MTLDLTKGIKSFRFVVQKLKQPFRKRKRLKKKEKGKQQHQ
jgi:hypothetical protein